jgi:hypothetical protein
VLRVAPGRETDVERLRAWLAWSAAVDRAIEAAEQDRPREGPRVVRPLPPALVAAYVQNGRRQHLRTRRWQTARAGT